MDTTPDVIPITRLRAETARVIECVRSTGSPAFISQQGRLTAVLLSRERYDQLLEMLADLDERGAGDQHRRRGPVDKPVQGFPPTRRRRLVDTAYGPVDPETAAFFASEGIWTEDQGGERPPYPWEERRAAAAAAAQSTAVEAAAAAAERAAGPAESGPAAATETGATAVGGGDGQLRWTLEGSVARGEGQEVGGGRCQ